MIKAAIQLIQETAQKAIGAKVIAELQEPRANYVQIGSALERIPRVPAVRGHAVERLADVIAFAEATTAGKHSKEPRMVLWHARDAVTLVLDDSDRRDLVQMALPWSDEYRAVANLGGIASPWLDQAAFVRFLWLNGLATDVIVAQFRRLRWASGQTANANLQRGKESLGREIEAEVAGAEELPTELVLSIPVYRAPGERTAYQVKCAVDTSPGDERLRLVPLPGELEKAVDLAQADIHKRLTDALGADIPVYYGTP